MSDVEMVTSAREDVEQLQSALTAVEAGLETVEMAASAVDTARPWFRRVLVILLVIGVVILVVGVVRAAIRSKGGNGDKPKPPEPKA